jgi:hypothetical protein
MAGVASIVVCSDLVDVYTDDEFAEMELLEVNIPLSVANNSPM